MYRTHTSDRCLFTVAHALLCSADIKLFADTYSQCSTLAHSPVSVILHHTSHIPIQPTMLPRVVRPLPNPVSESEYRTTEDVAVMGGMVGNGVTSSPWMMIQFLLKTGIDHNRQQFEPALQPYAKACELDGWTQVVRLASKEVARLNARKQPRPFSSIPTDIFHIVISFFTFREMAPLCRVSKEWRKDFGTIAPFVSKLNELRLFWMKWHEIVEFPHSLKSPLAKQIEGINLKWKQERGFDAPINIPVNQNTCLMFNAALNHITTDLPHLHGLELQYRINLPPLPPLSAHLRSLCLILTGPADEALVTIDETHVSHANLRDASHVARYRC